MSSPTVTVEGMDALADWVSGMGRRAGRAAILPIMKAAWLPVVAAEQGNIHSISGALAGSIKPRSGAGDYPGRVSVYAPATATTGQVVKAWRSRKARKQQHGFAARASLSGSRYYRVFYAGWVERGHRLVKRVNGALMLVGKGEVDPHPFAAPAVASVGEQAAQTAEDAVLKHIIEGDNG